MTCLYWKKNYNILTAYTKKKKKNELNKNSLYSQRNLIFKKKQNIFNLKNKYKYFKLKKPSLLNFFFKKLKYSLKEKIFIKIYNKNKKNYRKPISKFNTFLYVNIKDYHYLLNLSKQKKDLKINKSYSFYFNKKKNIF